MLNNLAEYLAAEIRVWGFAPPDPTGPRVYLQGQLHANESTASLVLHRLVERYRRTPPPLAVRIVPVANPLGWTTYAETGEGRLSVPGGHDWNRIFPAGQPGPAVTAEDHLRDRLLALSRGYDLVIDVHTPEFGWPHVYASTPARSLPTFADLPHVIFGAPVAPTFDEANLRAGVTAVTLELPNHGVLTKPLVDRWAARLHAELLRLARNGPADSTPGCCGTMVDLVPDVGGVSYAIAAPARLCRAGRPVLGIVARDGTRIELTAPADCVPLSYRRRAYVTAGSWAVRVLILDR